MKKRWAGILVTVVVVHVYALMQTTFPLYNSNMLFYYGFWILLTIYYTSYPECAASHFKENERYIEKIVQLWSVIVGISIFMPSSYVINKAWGSGRYFVSITGDSFRLAPTCLMIVTLVLGLYCLTKSKKYLFLHHYSNVWLFDVWFKNLSWNRTVSGSCFFGIYIVRKTVLLFFSYSISDTNGVLILNSAAGSKIAATTYTTNSFFDKWGTITNGRTVFWNLDLKYFFKENILNQLLGCGFNFDYQITKRFYTAAHWAYNDFISVLLNFGYIGLGIYIYSVYGLLKTFILDMRMPKVSGNFSVYDMVF